MEMPPFREEARWWTIVTVEKTTYRELPLKFEAGTG